VSTKHFANIALMKIIATYFFQNILSMVFLVLAVLVSIFSFFSLISEFEHIGLKGYSIFTSFKVVFLEIPKLSYEVMPFSTLIGSLLALGNLAEKKEIIIIQTSGGSKLLFARIQLLCISAMIFIMFILSEILIPRATPVLNAIESVHKTADKTGRDGIWLKIENNFAFIGKMIGKNTFSNIKVFTFSEDNNLVRAVFAPSAKIRDGFWYLQSAKITNFDGKSIGKEEHESFHWKTEINPKVVQILGSENQSHSFFTIYSYWNYARETKQQTEQLEGKFLEKISTPISVIAMLMIAIAWSKRPSNFVSTGRTIFLGGIIGLMYFVMSQVIQQMGVVFNLTPVISFLLLPVFLASSAILYNVFAPK